MPKATRNLSEIRLSRLTRDPLLRQWFERNEPDDAATIDRVSPSPMHSGSAAAVEFA
jgi:hypothetical protein